MATAAPDGVSRGPQPGPAARLASLVKGLAVAALSLAAGIGLVGAGLAWGPSREDTAAIARGARLYAAECAGCHGARLEGGEAARIRSGGGRPGDAPIPAPPLGASGHAWRHSDAELAAIVAHGTGGAGAADSGLSSGMMPAFAGQLGRGGIEAILAYVKSRWPAGIRAHQAALNPGGAEALAILVRDPAWTLPAQCLSPPVATDRL